MFSPKTVEFSEHSCNTFEHAAPLSTSPRQPSPPSVAAARRSAAAAASVARRRQRRQAARERQHRRMRGRPAPRRRAQAGLHRRPAAVRPHRGDGALVGPSASGALPSSCERSMRVHDQHPTNDTNGLASQFP
jgi:hypothetical protein